MSAASGEIAPVDNGPIWKKLSLFVAFVATVYGANWALGRYGIVPLGFGLMGPAGVYFAGLAFGLRDALHEAAGRAWVLAAVACGALLAYVIEDAITIPGGHVAIAVASAIAFGLSELADLAIYEPLRERNWPVAVVVSNVVGAVVDSALFLWLAFGSLDHLTGQVVGKSYMVALALPLVWAIRRRRTAWA
jgi:uncharacterized PurR-regulated membrane protein YhhQ (DUF165 family)